MQKQGTPLKVFSFYKNVLLYVDKNKKIKITSFRSQPEYLRQSAFIKRHCTRIYNEIENGFYSYKDLTMAFLFISYRSKIKLDEINVKLMKKILAHFTDRQLKEDKRFVQELNQELSFTNIKQYFKFLSGECIIYELFLKGLISPMLLIQFFELLEDDGKKEYIKLKRITDKLKQITNPKKES